MAKIIKKIVSLADGKQQHDKNTIMLANIVTILIFVVLVPMGLYFIGKAAISYLGDIKLPKVSVYLSGALIFTGLAIRTWCSYVHYKIGKGTPLYTNPTKKLIVVGPYRYSRNPIMLGMMIYYFALSLLFGSLTLFVTIFLFPSLFGNFYHKFIEEKELLMRFGNEYLDYRENVPFLLPSLRNIIKK